MELIDLHCHLLPGVDDGSKDLEMSLEMARAAVKQGISHIVLTPHHMDSTYVNHKADVLAKTATFQQALTAAQIPLTVFAGQEVHLTGDLLKALKADDILFLDANAHYLLLELPHSGVPAYTREIIFALQTQGIVPVIAHPERNHGIQKDPDKLYDFMQMGCLAQLTASSYVGVFGDAVEKLTAKIINSGMGTAFASDAHNFNGRRFLMDAAFDKLADQAGIETVERFKNNAKAIINGDDIAMPDFTRISAVKKKRRFWLF